jgi:HTH-type transcriptional repressor of NAD biosynthesis genes
MTRGLLAGRFLPPHAGHVLVGQTAAALVDELVILLRVAADDPVPATLRLAWLGEIFPHATVLRCDERKGARWSELAGAVLPGPIDLVFAGDEADAGLAAALGARHVPLDPHLETVPIDGATLRADPLAGWRYLPAPVRPHYARTICLHGPESTGKSTLAPALARHFDTLWLPEYGRTYCETFGLGLTMADLLAIGRTHDAMTQAAKRLCNGRLILDTDPLMTAAWAEMLFAEADPWFGAFRDTADLYLLLDIDIPWVDDGTRFFGGEIQRRRFFACSRDQLDRRGLAYALIGGPVEERFDRALEAIAAAGC